MTDAPATASAHDVTGLLEAVRTAGDGASDAKAALCARQQRAAQPDIVGALAGLHEGSPLGATLRAGLRAQGITVAAMAAAVRWHRDERAMRKGGGEGGSGRPERPERRLVRLDPDTDLNVEDAIFALLQDPHLYVRDGVLVRVTHEWGASPVIRAHTVASMRTRLTKFARFEKQSTDGEWEHVEPPDNVTAAVLETQETWGDLRVLVGIHETPFMRSDGTICQTPGYDTLTRCLFMPTITFPIVPDAPHAHCCEAMRFLWTETSHDFPWRGMGYAPPSMPNDSHLIQRYTEALRFPDAWSIVSAIFTIVGRPAVDIDIPAHVFSASGPGSGKGLGIDVVCLTATGRTSGKSTWPEQAERGDRDAEVGKMIACAAFAGDPLIIFDEVKGAFGGAAINNALTGKGKYKARILRESKAPECRMLAPMLAAGNNITLRDNTHRRALLAKIESPLENPETKKGFRHDRLDTWVTEHRGELVAAALTVLRGYVVAGRPDMGMPTWGGGFESWSELIPRAIVWAGGGNVMGCRTTGDAEGGNEEKDQIAAIIDAIAKKEDEARGESSERGGITLRALIDALYPEDRLKGRDIPDDGYNGARDALEAMAGCGPRTKPKSLPVASKLNEWKRRPIADRSVDIMTKRNEVGVMVAVKRGNAVLWTVKEGA